MLDLNRTIIRSLAASDAVNTAIGQAQQGAEREGRDYLGASALGHDCLRKLQWDWRRPVAHEARTLRIFERGHWWEEYAVRLLVAAGFRMLRTGPRLSFEQMGGRFRGHADGIIVAGPAIPGLSYPCLWECKGLGAKGWTKLSRDGLAKAYPGYADQVAVYQAYLELADTPALFTAANLDTMEILHLLVPFDAARAQAASDRAVTVVNADAAGETLPRVGADATDFRCRLCGHREACWA